MKKAKEWLDNRNLDTNIEFEKAWELFLNNYRLRNRETSYRDVLACGKAHLLPRFKFKKVREITKRDQKQVIKDTYEITKSPEEIKAERDLKLQYSKTIDNIFLTIIEDDQN